MIPLIGFILLIGIVEKNGIMMVDFALEAERKGKKGTFMQNVRREIQPLF